MKGSHDGLPIRAARRVLPAVGTVHRLGGKTGAGWCRLGTWVVPLLGIIFLPFATLMYVILYTPGLGLTGWEWFWVILAALFDVAHLAAGIARRRELMQSAQRA